MFGNSEVACRVVHIRLIMNNTTSGTLASHHVAFQSRIEIGVLHALWFSVDALQV